MIVQRCVANQGEDVIRGAKEPLRIDESLHCKIVLNYCLVICAVEAFLHRLADIATSGISPLVVHYRV